MQDIKSRTVTFLLSVLVLTGSIYLSKFGLLSILFVGALAAVVCVALWEYYGIAAHKGAKPMYTLGILGALFYLASLFLSLYFPVLEPLPAIIIGVLVFLFFLQSLFIIKHPILDLSTSLFGFIYVVVSLGYIIKINFFFAPNAPVSGQWWFMYLVVVTKAMDFGAYFIGKSIGKHYLAPKISPKKTVEGLIGGMFFSCIASILLVFCNPHVLQTLNHPWLFTIIMALVLSLSGQLGDLAESLIKRDAKVKDSNKIKGSGGILDMVDSLIFAVPIFYLYLAYGT